MYLKKLIRTVIRLIALQIITAYTLFAQSYPASSFSTAGFFSVPESGRTVYDFNVGWRFHKGDKKNASLNKFNDKDWPIINTPNGLELLPVEASGCKNYQGKAWYRKHFMLPKNSENKKIELYFEAIMGKARIYVNGKLAAEHFGGYLPIIIDLSKCDISYIKDNLIAVLADNSDDPLFPPGKMQSQLDFTYFGGIYRDVWLITTNAIHITDNIAENKTAGGGSFIHFENVSDKYSDILVETCVANESALDKKIVLKITLKDVDGKNDQQSENTVLLKSGIHQTISQKLRVYNPKLWQPDQPYLYKLYFEIKDISGKAIDGFYQRIGIRKIEFNGKEGFYLNGKYFNDKLIGANRHQDFAYLGNAVPNSLHWRDAKKLRDAGIRIIRTHYPQDPAFMDACDELGLFVIVSTAGWQFWNPDSLFVKRCYDDIRNMVRRDRNHPSVTHYPAYFAKEAYQSVHEEYPYPGCFASCDINTAGYQNYDVLYSHPDSINYSKTEKSLFTREWGDNVDDWSSHNSNSRVARSWGESAQLIQAIHYANPDYPFTSFQSIYQSPRQLVGGCFWHSFDHQRGYHPDPFYGGIMDAFRQPKYSYEMFKSQRNPSVSNPLFESGYSIYIANEMTPFSSPDITVFSNCDEVRLIIFGRDSLTQKSIRSYPGMPSPPFVFKNVYHFMQLKALHRAGKWKEAKIIAEGIVNGKVIINTEKMPAKRADKITLRADNENQVLRADGSDIVVVVASITDNEGNVKRLNNESVIFEVTGEGEMVGDERIGANPRIMEWGTAPVLIRATTNPGKIIIKASLAFEGNNSPKPAFFELESFPAKYPLLFKETATKKVSKINDKVNDQNIKMLQEKIKKLTEELNQVKLKQVEHDQEIFEHKKAD